jgi:hypothetical protein
MELNKLGTTMFDDLPTQVSIRVLSTDNDLYAIWREKNELMIEVYYCKKNNKINLLEGSLGTIIRDSTISEEQKITKCYEALEKVIMTQNNLARIRMQKALICKNNELMCANEKLINRAKIN